VSFEGRRLKAVTAFALDSGADPASTWVEIGLSSDKDDLQSRVAILDAGYLGTSAPVGWTGDIAGEPTMHVYADVYSSVSTVVRLALLVE
jgi:hypothetical protein